MASKLQQRRILREFGGFLIVPLDYIVPGSIDGFLWKALTEYRVLAARFKITAAAADSTIQLYACRSGTAPGSGRALLVSAPSLTTMALNTDTRVLAASGARLHKNEWIGVSSGGGTTTGLAGLSISLELARG